MKRKEEIETERRRRESRRCTGLPREEKERKTGNKKESREKTKLPTWI
jgi:hypothetical protein